MTCQKCTKYAVLVEFCLSDHKQSRELHNRLNLSRKRHALLRPQQIESHMHMTNRQICTGIVFASAMSLGAPAIAQERLDLQAGIAACRDLAATEQRLACYDALPVGDASAASVTIDRQGVETLERDAFGFTLPSLSRLFPALGGESVSRVELTIDRVVDRGDGSHLFLMSNGQRWLQIEAMPANNVRAGDAVEIRRGALGSFVLVSPRGGAPHRVRREN